MPQRRTAIKDLRKNRRRHMHNLDVRTDLKKTLKEFTLAPASKKAENLKTVYKKIDKAAKRNIIHKKTAARRKAKFARLAAAAK